MRELAFHPLTEVLPLIEGEEFSELARQKKKLTNVIAPPAEPAMKTWTDAAGYFEQLRHGLAIAKVANGARQHNKVGSYIDEILARLEPDVTAAVLASVMPKPPPRPKRVKPEPPPPERDEEYASWLASRPREPPI